MRELWAVWVWVQLTGWPSAPPPPLCFCASPQYHPILCYHAQCTYYGQHFLLLASTWLNMLLCCWCTVERERPFLKAAHSTNHSMRAGVVLLCFSSLLGPIRGRWDDSGQWLSPLRTEDWNSGKEGGRREEVSERLLALLSGSSDLFGLVFWDV